MAQIQPRVAGEDGQKVLFRDVDPEMLTLTMMFGYMIVNTDFSLYLLHNLRLLRTPSAVYTVPYDFDLSGLINTRYCHSRQPLERRHSSSHCECP